MIISRAPLRISLLGGGTDYRDYYVKYGGKIFGFAIDSFIYFISHELPPTSIEKIRFTYRITESVMDINEIQHPALREELKRRRWTEKVNLATLADLPGNSGLGSSSSFCSSMILNLNEFQGQVESKMEIAKRAVDLERNILKEVGGEQDQYLSTLGGINILDFNANDVSRKEIVNHELTILLESHLVLVPWMGVRQSSLFATQAKRGIMEQTVLLRDLQRIAEEFERDLQLINSLGVKLVFERLMESLRLSWKLKLQINTDEATQSAGEFITEAISLGALGGKLCGAGGGGYLALFIPRENQVKVLKRLGQRICLRPKIDFSGVKIVTELRESTQRFSKWSNLD